MGSVTNKPKIDVTEANINAGGATTAHGAPSGNIDATINIPLIAEHPGRTRRDLLTSAAEGSCINNLPATFAAPIPTPAFNTTSGGKVPANSVRDQQLPYGRKSISILSPIRALAPSCCTGSMRTGAHCLRSPSEHRHGRRLCGDGGKFTRPAATRISACSSINPSYNKDRFENTVLTIDGRIGDLKLVYAGAFSCAM